MIPPFRGSCVPRILVALITCSLHIACEIDTKLTVRGYPPEFVISGSGTLGALRVIGPKKQRESEDPAAGSTYWEIRPEKGYLSGQPIETLKHVVYGKVPPAYVQVYPERGDAPTLSEGERYQVWINAVNANGAFKYFTIREGKAVEETP